MEIRIGLGYDSHVFTPGVPLRIGGLTLDHPEGLAGHSDGDVLLHAITDALLGAVAAGDIGSFFPPGDPLWKDADFIVIMLISAMHRNRYLRDLIYNPSVINRIYFPCVDRRPQSASHSGVLHC